VVWAPGLREVTVTTVWGIIPPLVRPFKRSSCVRSMIVTLCSKPFRNRIRKLKLFDVVVIGGLTRKLPQTYSSAVSARNQHRFPSTPSVVNGVAYPFLYAPIIVLVILCFNSSRFSTIWQGSRGTSISGVGAHR
jgi:hypothetical protein